MALNTALAEMLRQQAQRMRSGIHCELDPQRIDQAAQAIDDLYACREDLAAERDQLKAELRAMAERSQ